MGVKINMSADPDRYEALRHLIEEPPDPDPPEPDMSGLSDAELDARLSPRDRAIAAAIDAADAERYPSSDPDVRSSWWPKELGPVLDGTWRPPEPTVGRRSDGRGLFYAGKSHTMIGESEAGKGWGALSAVRDELDAGNHVVYVDFEDDESSVVGRLLALSAKPVPIDEQFHYIRPEGPLLGRSRADLDEALHAYSPTLAICDGVTEAMALHGLDPNKNADIAIFNGRLIKPLTDAGAAAVSLDHVVKNGDDRGRYALGGSTS
jgi:hypothetical protein